MLVASPNDGTPLATPKRWDDTVGWIANLLEMFPDNPFTTGAAFVANGLVWLANHASGDLPGLHSMDADGELIAAIQSPPGSARPAPTPRWSPTTTRPATTLQRLLDVGIDQFFGTANDLVVPSEGGWRVDRPAQPVSFRRADRMLRARRQPRRPIQSRTSTFSRTPQPRSFSSTRCSAGNSR